jgi:hypothetical protein
MRKIGLLPMAKTKSVKPRIIPAVVIIEEQSGSESVANPLYLDIHLLIFLYP